MPIGLCSEHIPQNVFTSSIAKLYTNLFDETLMSALNAFAQRWLAFDAMVVRCSNSDLLKGGAVVAVLWWIWFQKEQPIHGRNPRSSVLATIVGCLAGIALARVFQLTLPFRLRPIHDPTLAFRPPYGLDLTRLDGWSSFPSDHAALFIGLSTGLFFISRRLGLLSLIYVVVLIMLPRAYNGLHYPTDLLAGGALGALCVVISNLIEIKKDVMVPILNWEKRHAPSFYACFFLFMFQLATLFDGARSLVGIVKDLAKIY